MGIVKVFFLFGKFGVGKLAKSQIKNDLLENEEFYIVRGCRVKALLKIKRIQPRFGKCIFP